MHNKSTHRFLRPETVTAFCIIVVAASFLIPTTELAPLSALLPAAMLVGLILLAIVMMISDQRKASAGEEAKPVVKSPKRVFGAFCLIALYCIAVDLIGFYPSTAISLPLVAYIFGYRDLRGLAIATVIVLVAIYLIFSVSMSQEFPIGLLWAE
nr:tripartite tricarboxylate transporter TctB family protein [uncultured Cohaesibacter sp.]